MGETSQWFENQTRNRPPNRVNSNSSFLRMTWYADEILLRATDDAVARIRADVTLAPFAYHVANLDDFTWHSPGHYHELPEGGLLVVRPVGRPVAHQRWYGEAVLDWSSLKPEGKVEDVQLAPDADERLRLELEDEDVPPRAFRTYLSELAQDLRAPLMYYSCSMWGGDVDSEYCLVYGPNETLHVTETTPSPTEPQGIDSLRAGLRCIGADIPSPFFLLHTRAFPWQDYRLLK